MKSRIVSYIALLFFALLVLLTGCGNSQSAKGVPDRTAELVILDYFDERGMRQGDYNSYSFNVIHNYDKSSNSDAAVINLKIEYNYAVENTYVPVWYSYNKSSELWTLDRKGNWSESAISFSGEKLIGRWRISNYDDNYEIEIKSVNGDSITLDYDIYAAATVSMGLDPDRMLSVDGSGTYSLSNWGITIPFDLPDGFYCNKGGGRFGEKSTDLNIRIDPQQGCNSGYIYGSLSFVQP